MNFAYRSLMPAAILRLEGENSGRRLAEGRRRESTLKIHFITA